jgi:plastocyanin
MFIISIVLLLGLGSTALVLGGAISKSLNGHTATTLSNESQTSSARINSGNTSNSFFLGMNVLPTIRLIPLGGNANFTVVLYNGGDLTGNYSLSAAVPPGFSFAVAPPVAITGAGPHPGGLQLRSSSEMSPGTYQVTIKATGARGVANQTFDFYVQRNLVVLKGGNVPVFLSITVKAGETVTWVSMDGPMSDDSNPWHTVIFLKSNLTSGGLQQYETWSHTFTQPGIYRYYDDGDLQIAGEVIVAP